MTPPVPQGGTPFERLVDLMRILRGEGGCPWDREQTHLSLTPYVIEEAYEVVECIEEGALPKLREELGDLLLQVVFHAQLATEEGLFTADDVAEAIIQKMLRRHPHVFGETAVADSAGVLRQWEQIKQQERREKAAGDEPAPFVSLLQGIPRGLPALLAAERVSSRAAEVGFEFEAPEQALAKVHEEIGEALEAWRSGDPERARDEMGDVLFAVANLCRMMGILSEDALRRTVGRFTQRFGHIERTAHDRGGRVADLGLEEMLRLWEESKSRAGKDAAVATPASSENPPGGPGST